MLSCNPLFPNKVTRYELTPDVVDCMVSCSKGFTPFLPHIMNNTERIHICLHYTITAYSKDMEPVFPLLSRA